MRFFQVSILAYLPCASLFVVVTCSEFLDGLYSRDVKSPNETPILSARSHLAIRHLLRARDPAGEAHIDAAIGLKLRRQVKDLALVKRTLTTAEVADEVKEVKAVAATLDRQRHEFDRSFARAKRGDVKQQQFIPKMLDEIQGFRNSQRAQERSYKAKTERWSAELRAAGRAKDAKKLRKAFEDVVAAWDRSHTSAEVIEKEYNEIKSTGKWDKKDEASGSKAADGDKGTAHPKLRRRLEGPALVKRTISETQVADAVKRMEDNAARTDRDREFVEAHFAHASPNIDRAFLSGAIERVRHIMNQQRDIVEYYKTMVEEGSGQLRAEKRGPELEQLKKALSGTVKARERYHQLLDRMMKEAEASGSHDKGTSAHGGGLSGSESGSSDKKGKGEHGGPDGGGKSGAGSRSGLRKGFL
ncbi:hypothetical protein MMC10_003560 [Thelotrema lepadinum]|nr:hypothetical protein [Thelotrema lepadinum]